MTVAETQTLAQYDEAVEAKVAELRADKGFLGPFRKQLYLRLKGKHQKALAESVMAQVVAAYNGEATYEGRKIPDELKGVAVLLKGTCESLACSLANAQQKEVEHKLLREKAEEELAKDAQGKREHAAELQLQADEADARADRADAKAKERAAERKDRQSGEVTDGTVIDSDDPADAEFSAPGLEDLGDASEGAAQEDDSDEPAPDPKAEKAAAKQTKKDRKAADKQAKKDAKGK